MGDGGAVGPDGNGGVEPYDDKASAVVGPGVPNPEAGSAMEGGT
jgi:hypothetical protein